MFTITKESQVEIVEKKSKFITRSKNVFSEEEALSYINQIKKSEKGATHNCYAFRILNDDKIIERKNDDGEPGGTAGSPMLAVLTGEELINVLVITTRFFGGIKLGSGGLVNVYKRGVVEVIRVSGKENYKIFKEHEINFNISQTHRIDYILKKENIKVIDKIFNGENVRYMILVEKDNLQRVIEMIK